MIELPFVVLRATGHAGQAAPTLLLGGGPGPSIVSVLGAVPAAQLAGLPLRRDRDLIVLEQRGAALTMPDALDCPELLGEAGKPPGFASVAAATAAAMACRSRLAASGVRTEAYNTVETAADVEGLQRLLGSDASYRSWHIAATSYGTRVAQVLLARRRLKVETVVLDGPLPLAGSALHSAALLESIDALAAACAGLPGCGNAFPGLRQNAEAGLAALLARQPLRSGDTVIDFEIVHRRLRAALAEGDLMRALTTLDALGRLDWAALAANLGLNQVPPVMPTPSGLFHAVMCADERPALRDPHALPMEGLDWPDGLRRAVAGASGFPTAALCPAWSLGSATLPTPVSRPDVPMLVIAGELDPLTPPGNYGRHLRPYYPDSRLLVVPMAGHGLLESLPCVQEAAAQFQHRPEKAVSLRCTKD